MTGYKLIHPIDAMSEVSKYIEIVLVGTSPSGKTKVWEVRNKKEDAEVGIIRWAGNWRKYVYECGPTYYDWDCLRMIADFIEDQTKIHYGEKQ